MGITRQRWRRSTAGALASLAVAAVAGIALAGPAAAALPRGSVQVMNRQWDFFQLETACLTVGDNDQSHTFFNGENVRVWDCAFRSQSSNAQAWVPQKVGGTDQEPIRTLSPAVDRRFCLDVARGSRADGANIQISACNGTDAQRFRVVPLSSWFLLRNVGSDQCVDKSGWDVVQHFCNAPHWQQWVFGEYAFP